MKRTLQEVSLAFALILSILLSSCTKMHSSGGLAETKPEITSLELGKYYLMVNDEKLRFDSGEDAYVNLELKEGDEFFIHMDYFLISYRAIGNYRIEDGKVICWVPSDDKGNYKYIYVFNIQDENTLTFNEGESIQYYSSVHAVRQFKEGDIFIKE